MTQARKLARQARRYGHYDNQRTRAPGERRRIWVACPECRTRVYAEVHTPTPKLADLDQAVVAHLLYDCQATT